MKPSLLLEKNRDAIRAAAGRRGLANLRVFGSVLHGEDHEGSDLDLLVDAPPGRGLLDLCGLEEDLETLLGIRVEVLTPGFLSKKFRARVVAEARPV